MRPSRFTFQIAFTAETVGRVRIGVLALRVCAAAKARPAFEVPVDAGATERQGYRLRGPLEIRRMFFHLILLIVYCLFPDPVSTLV